MGESDTWANYSAAIRTEYFDSHEAASAQLKLSQLRYRRDIRAYMTEFRALNNLTRVTGESLQEKIDLAMPEAVIDMQFAHYLGEFTDDEGFLHTTYQAALQVERKKALKQAKEQIRGQTGNPGSSKMEKKEDKRQENRTSSKQKESHPRESPSNAATKPTWFGKKNTWPTMDEAMKGLPNNEKEEYRQSREDCWRCGWTGHKTYKCLSFKTRHGTVLPPASWKIGVVLEGKRKRDDEGDTTPAAKQQKVSAVETMDVNPMPLWESEEEDF